MSFSNVTNNQSTDVTKVVFSIEESDAHAKVSQSFRNGTERTSRVLLQDLPKLITDSTSGIVTTTDTGYISPYLIREQTTTSQVRRMYLYPEIKVKVHLVNAFQPRANNPYGFTNAEDSRGDRLLVMPGFIFKNFCVFVNNTNNEDFTNVVHRFGCVSTDMFNQVSDESRLYYVALNHFDDSVCWHRDFDRTLLTSRSTIRQASLAYSYLQSYFNQDLDIRLRLNPEVVDRHADALKTYLTTAFEMSDASAVNVIQQSKSNNYYAIMVVMYYLNTCLDYRIESIMSPEAITSNYAGRALRELFSNV